MLALREVRSWGTAAGDSTQEFHGIAGARYLKEASVVLIADQGSHSVRVFSDDGHYLRSVGRPGRGPGDIAFMTGLMTSDSTMAVVQGNQVSRWTLEGRFLTVWEPSVPGRQLSLLGPLGSGTWVAATGPQATFVPGLEAQVARLYRIPTTGGPATSIAEVYWRTVLNVVSGRGVTGYAAPYAAEGMVATGDGAFWYANGSDPTVRRIGPDGATLIEVKLPYQPSRVSAEDRRAYVDRLFPVPHPDEARIRRELGPAAFPAFHSAIVQLVAAPHGSVWVGLGASADEPGRLWCLVSQNGRVLGKVRLPPEDRLLDAADGYVLVSHEDKEGVERVALMAFRGGAP